ncbi:MAG: leucine-rich repeat domain-containing protein, partial [Bacteroidaceae bacterium]|nr:leucine-rich repeat domain-containing protein [Bacteroidaceae bacterium]
KLQKITLPSTLQSLGAEAFADCSSATEATMYYSMAKVSDKAFAGCSSIEMFVATETPEFGENAFYGCTSLKDFFIHEKLTKIAENAFEDCTGIEYFDVDENNPAFCCEDGVVYDKQMEILMFFPQARGGTYTMPSTVKRVSALGLINSHVTRLVCSDGIRKLDMKNFSNIQELESLTLPASLEEINTADFSGCPSLREINISEENPMYCSHTGVLYDKERTEIVMFPHGREGGLILPLTVNRIGEGAMENCTKLTYLTITSRIKEIGDRALKGCTALAECNLPKGLLRIGVQAFAGCTALEEMTIPETVTELGIRAFEGSGLKSITFMDSPIKKVPDQCFYQCERLKEANLSEPMTEIGRHAFAYCNYLESIEMPKNVEQIDDYAFEHCWHMHSIILNKKLKKIGRESFYQCPEVVELRIPGSVEEIGVAAFASCSHLQTLTFSEPSALKELGYMAFGHNLLHTELTLPESLETIGGSCFMGAWTIILRLPKSLKNIGPLAFSYNNLMEHVYTASPEPQQIEDGCFMQDVMKSCTLHVPVGSKERYETANVWREFTKIVEDESLGTVGVKTIRQDAGEEGLSYDLQGRRADEHTKGVVIRNGKKMMRR